MSHSAFMADRVNTKFLLSSLGDLTNNPDNPKNPRLARLYRWL